MRRFDKKENIKKANILLEERMRNLKEYDEYNEWDREWGDPEIDPEAKLKPNKREEPKDPNNEIKSGDVVTDIFGNNERLVITQDAFPDAVNYGQVTSLSPDYFDNDRGTYPLKNGKLSSRLIAKGVGEILYSDILEKGNNNPNIIYDIINNIKSAEQTFESKDYNKLKQLKESFDKTFNKIKRLDEASNMEGIAMQKNGIPYIATDKYNEEYFWAAFYKKPVKTTHPDGSITSTPFESVQEFLVHYNDYNLIDVYETTNIDSNKIQMLIDNEEEIKLPTTDIFKNNRELERELEKQIQTLYDDGREYEQDNEPDWDNVRQDREDWFNDNDY